MRFLLSRESLYPMWGFSSDLFLDFDACKSGYAVCIPPAVCQDLPYTDNSTRYYTCSCPLGMYANSERSCAGKRKSNEAFWLFHDGDEFSKKQSCFQIFHVIYWLIAANDELGAVLNLLLIESTE